jgi:hypothetical protein
MAQGKQVADAIRAIGVTEVATIGGAMSTAGRSAVAQARASQSGRNAQSVGQSSFFPVNFGMLAQRDKEIQRRVA